MSEEKICPFMSEPDDYVTEPALCGTENSCTYTTSGIVYCKKEKCMAWGELGSKYRAFEGCKLIERKK